MARVSYDSLAPLAWVSYRKHRPTKGLCLGCNSQAKGQMQGGDLLAIKLAIDGVCVQRLCGEMLCKLLVKVVNFDGCPTLVGRRSTPAWTMSMVVGIVYSGSKPQNWATSSNSSLLDQQSYKHGMELLSST